MQAYENGLKPNDTRLMLRPDSNFFRFFNDPSGKLPAQGGSAPASEPPSSQPRGNAPTGMRPEAMAPRAAAPAQTR